MDVTYSFRSVHELQNFLELRGVLITGQRKVGALMSGCFMKSILKYTQMAFWRIEKRLMEGDFKLNMDFHPTQAYCQAPPT